GDIHQAVWRLDTDRHSLVRLVVPLVLARPPDAGTLAFARCSHPRPALHILAEGDSTEPPGRLRRPRILDLDFVGSTSRERPRKVDKDGRQLSLELRRRSFEQNLINCKMGIEIELNPAVILQHLESNGNASA